MNIKTMPTVRSCTATECAYNNEKKCHASGITIDGPAPLCDTYFMSSHKGGVEATGTVGACKNDLCVYNASFECTAAAIDVAPHFDRGRWPVCNTFTKRRVAKEAWDV